MYRRCPWGPGACSCLDTWTFVGDRQICDFIQLAEVPWGGLLDLSWYSIVVAEGSRFDYQKAKSSGIASCPNRRNYCRSAERQNGTLFLGLFAAIREPRCSGDSATCRYGLCLCASKYAGRCFGSIRRPQINQFEFNAQRKDALDAKSIWNDDVGAGGLFDCGRAKLISVRSAGKPSIHAEKDHMFCVADWCSSALKRGGVSMR